MPRPSRSGLTNVALEVWLGPMEGVRCGRPLGSSDVLRIGRRPMDEKQKVKNDLVLAEGKGISGFHAEVRFSDGTLYLKDLNSTNGTYADNSRVSGEVEIQPGEVFALSTTPIEALVGEDAGLAAAADAGSSAALSLQKMQAAVRASAQRRAEGWADTRHLVDALLRSSDPAITSSLKAAGWSGKDALEELWSEKLFRGPYEWLGRFLQAPDEARGTGTEPPTSLRVNLIFAVVAQRLSKLRGADAESRAPGALLAMLLESAGPVGPWLDEHHVEAPELPGPKGGGDVAKTGKLTRVSRTAIRPRADDATTSARRTGAPSEGVPVAPATRPSASSARLAAAPARAAPPAPAPAPAPRAPAPLPLSTGDVVLDQRARAIALELEEAAVLYRFSTPEDRRSAMKTVVNRALAAIAPENRTRILTQIRVQFPVIAAPAMEPAGEVPRLLQRIDELEQRVAQLLAERQPERKESRSSAVGTASLQDVLVQAPVERGAPPELPVLREVVEFARRMEKFLLGVIQAVTMPGDGTTSFRLNAYRYTLESVLAAMAQGKPVDRERLPEYLRELERWQVAILAAHHEGARIWFEKFWKKVSPAAIEASTAKAGSWKLRGDATEWWTRYRDAVKGLNSEVVQDQVLQAAYRFAQEEFDKLTKRRQQ
jgi:hypothetical protein